MYGTPAKWKNITASVSYVKDISWVLILNIYRSQSLDLILSINYLFWPLSASSHSTHPSRILQPAGGDLEPEGGAGKAPGPQADPACCCPRGKHRPLLETRNYKRQPPPATEPHPVATCRAAPAHQSGRRSGRLQLSLTLGTRCPGLRGQEKGLGVSWLQESKCPKTGKQHQHFNAELGAVRWHTTTFVALGRDH